MIAEREREREVSLTLNNSGIVEVRCFSSGMENVPNPARSQELIDTRRVSGNLHMKGRKICLVCIL